MSREEAISQDRGTKPAAHRDDHQQDGQDAL
jgi:hypothetical protein